MRTRRPRCSCGRPAYPDQRTARMASARGTRQSENPLIHCVAFRCPAIGEHTMLWPAGEPVTFCYCGQPKYATLHGADVMLEHLTAKHPDDENPYVMYRCTDGGIHIARNRAVPASAHRAVT